MTDWKHLNNVETLRKAEEVSQRLQTFMRALDTENESAGLCCSCASKAYVIALGDRVALELAVSGASGEDFERFVLIVRGLWLDAARKYAETIRKQRTH